MRIARTFIDECIRRVSVGQLDTITASMAKWWVTDMQQKVLDECEVPVDEVDVYVPHQANVRIIDHARRKLGISEERTVVNVDRFGNTSSGSIPLALGDAEADGRLVEGEMVLMTGMGAGLTWGSALIEWTANGKGGQE